MHLVTAEEMRRLDRHTIDTIGLPALVLMENAGRAIAEAALALSAQLELRGGPARWLVLAGKGNNGGDGLVAARHLCEAGAETAVVYAEPPERLTGDAAVQRDALARFGIAASVCAPGAIDWRAYDGVIDALLGTGTRGAPREPYASLIREANASGLPIVAADIPSGLDADTGAVHEPCIRADRTVALAFRKRGLALHPGREVAGDVSVAPIGIPAWLAETYGVRAFHLDEAAVRKRLGIDPSLPRRTDTHKGTYGHVLVAAGSLPMAGAGLLCVRAALRAGCGLATWAVPARLAEPLLGRVPEAMLAPLADGGRGDWAAVPAEALAALCTGRSALVLGPGLGRFEGDSAWLRRVWEATAGVVPPVAADAGTAAAQAGDTPGAAAAAHAAAATTTADAACAASVAAQAGDTIGAAAITHAAAATARATTAADAASAASAPARAAANRSPKPLPLVLDADALNMLADADDFAGWVKRPAGAPAVLTPHPGEMARLLRCTVPEVQRDRIGAARSYAEKHGVYVVLKGAGTVIATPAGIAYVNSTGNAGMATGGSGDVLAGIIGSLLAQGWDAEKAAAFGVWWHGRAGDRAAEARMTTASLMAGDIADYL
ncbi:NAD(P)H-hydrate epimerase [Paenibacillus allorhizosphaerae]|uniref:Multifunctional fusion protein n=1 Tax=Paenibacillus allorhizosphaerae TaxID=2849866 RepID=A0ABN7TR13_9BACL|nr:NAD(P)H-hydrate epimerase [Paenibacillus allorhizosphaerae]CAG7645287.1 NAD(P)H-hydrate epimerase [Paenibacillus allorhizosphaerae]